jgi:hypothetical protein
MKAGREATYLLLLQGKVLRWVVSGTVDPEWSLTLIACESTMTFVLHLLEILLLIMIRLPESVWGKKHVLVAE